MNRERVKNMVELCLAVASKERGELGPIHLLKYIYLADCAHAKETGESYSEIDWEFYRLGPWSQPANAEIEESARGLGAQERRFDYDRDGREGEGTRWSLPGRSLDPGSVYDSLPTSVRGTIKNKVREFGQDTAALLHYVYRTPPMLKAAPREILDVRLGLPAEESKPSQVPVRPTKSDERRLKRLRERAAKKKAARAVAPTKFVRPVVNYDETFFRGLEGFDEQDEFPDEFVATVADEAWKSPGRGGDE